MTNNTEEIKHLIHSAVESFSAQFQDRHEQEINDPDGTINMKIHNVFIATLGPEIQYYTALVRSLDSSLGNMLEKLAINIAGLFYDVGKNVEGPLSIEQTRGIAELLEKYKRHEKIPQIKDYQFLRTKPDKKELELKRHDSDYYLVDKKTDDRYLIELKIGGDLDNKKARSEKEALLEQFAIASNVISGSKNITIYFATAYNRFGEGKPWNQERVKQFFAKDELLIGRQFWDFICKSDKGYEIVLDAYREKAHLITKALESIKTNYLGGKK